MEMTNKLKPCPFCGGSEEDGMLGQGADNNPLWDTVFNIECECDARGEPCEKWKDAIETWNIRPIEDELETKLLQLEQSLINIHA